MVKSSGTAAVTNSHLVSTSEVLPEDDNCHWKVTQQVHIATLTPPLPGKVGVTPAGIEPPCLLK